MSGKGFIIYIAPNASFFLFKIAVKLLVCEARSASDPAGKAYIIARSSIPAVSILDREWAVQQSIYLVVPHS